MSDPAREADELEAIEPGWEPEWRVSVGAGEIGLVVDDGCFVALVRDEWGYWIPTPYVPREAALLMGDLALFSSP